MLFYIQLLINGVLIISEPCQIRTKHVEGLLEEFMSSREEAASLERKIHRKNIRDIQDALDSLKVIK